LVLSSHTIEHIPRPENALADWLVLLKPGGLLFVEAPLENPHPLNCGSKVLEEGGDVYYGGHVSFFSSAHLIKMTENAGFELLRIGTCMGPVNPILEEPTPISAAFSGQDRICKLLCRKPTSKLPSIGAVFFWGISIVTPSLRYEPFFWYTEVPSLACHGATVEW
jgi:hypothetical protein